MSLRTTLLNDHALLCEAAGSPSIDAQRRIWALAGVAADWPAVREIVPGVNNLLLVVDPLATDPESLIPRVERAWSTLRVPAATTGPLIDIPVHYGGDDGPDLAQVARHAGLTPDEVVARHAQGEYTVLCMGFQPGFAYLGGLDPVLATPRRETPRARLPAGSVAIGGSQTAIYPAATPGGWHLIGRTDVVMFDPRREAPSLLTAGARVRFVPVEHPPADPVVPIATEAS